MRSVSVGATKKIAEKLAKKILRQSLQKHATVITLRGELGAGKTAFTQGFARAIGIRQRVTSPTFLLIRRYPLKHTKYFTDFFHIDAYHIKNIRELINLDIRAVVSNPRHIVIIEWPERVRTIIPRTAIQILLHHGRVERERLITFLKKKPRA